MHQSIHLHESATPRPLRLRQQITAAQSLGRARDIIRAAPPICPVKLTIACRTILQHSQNASERNAAAVVLSEINAAA